MKLENEDRLREVYGHAKGRAKDKVLPELEEHSINFISRSPFVVISTANSAYEMDTSPRGGDPGFVKVLDTLRLLIPDSNGNNRVDSMVNIVETGRIGTLFLIPGVNETLRVNGRVSISQDPEHLSPFHAARNPPKSCLLIEVEEVFLHCAKALMRSNLWAEDNKIDRSELPSTSQMMNDQLGLSEPVEAQEAMIERYKKDL